MPVVGDLGKAKLGISAADMTKMKGKIKHLFHLAAICDLSADAESQRVANIDGTRTVEFAEAIKAGCFITPLPSPPPALCDGTFREHVRGSRGTRSPVLPHQARFRRHCAQ